MPSAAGESGLRRALTSGEDLGSVSLATRMLVSRLRREVAADPAALPAAVAELNDFFAANPSAQPDLAHLDGGGAG